MVCNGRWPKYLSFAVNPIAGLVKWPLLVVSPKFATSSMILQSSKARLIA
uniref:Uncharacterized protein n=1 Tax=Arundo donax TaxID=35708 RepID=A0A0A9G200_ARUDO